MSTIAVNAITDASGGSAASINGYTPSASNMTGRNRIINGEMLISQRATSATVSGGGYYALDRWRWSQGNSYGAAISPTISQESDAPANFSKSMKFIVGTGTAVTTNDVALLEQYIEGFNTADLAFGTSDAKTITLSFWVKASITGTYCAYFQDATYNRSLIKEYTINSANTWEKKTITVAGDTGGTGWVGATNGIGLAIGFTLGVGSGYQGSADTWVSQRIWGTSNQTSLTATTGATFYLTGVQLEVGSTASEFEHRLYGQELALCQRYYEVAYATSGTRYSDNIVIGHFAFKVTKRTTPTVTYAKVSGGGGSPVVLYSPTIEYATAYSTGHSVSGGALFSATTTAEL